MGAAYDPQELLGPLLLLSCASGQIEVVNLFYRDLGGIFTPPCRTRRRHVQSTVLPPSAGIMRIGHTKRLVLHKSRQDPSTLWKKRLIDYHSPSTSHRFHHAALKSL